MVRAGMGERVRRDRDGFKGGSFRILFRFRRFRRGFLGGCRVRVVDLFENVRFISWREGLVVNVRLVFGGLRKGLGGRFWSVLILFRGVGIGGWNLGLLGMLVCWVRVLEVGYLFRLIVITGSCLFSRGFLVVLRVFVKIVVVGLFVSRFRRLGFGGFL